MTVYGRVEQRAYACHDPEACDAVTVVTVHPDGRYEPGYIEPDYCGGCGEGLGEQVEMPERDWEAEHDARLIDADDYDWSPA